MGILATWGYKVLLLEVQQSLQFIEVCATMVCVCVCAHIILPEGI